MLITFNPEDSKDFNVEGGSGLPKLPVNPDNSDCIYNIEAAISKIEHVQKENAPAKLAVTFAVTNPKATGLSIGQEFGEFLNLFHPKPIVSQIARQTVAKIGYGVTGDKKIMEKGSLNFDESLYNKPMSMVIEAKRVDGGLDNHGETKYFVNNNIKKIEPIAGGNTQPTQPQTQSYNTAPQGQQQPAAWGAPQ